MTNHTTTTDHDETSIEIEGHRFEEGDFVRVRPTPGKRDGFIGKIRAWHVTDDGRVSGIDIWGGPRDYASMRTFYFERLEPLSTRRQNKLRRAEVEFYEEHGRRYPFNPNSIK